MVGDSQLLRFLHPDFVDSQAINEQFYKLRMGKDFPAQIELTVPEVALPAPDPTITGAFFSREVFENQGIGEFRNVVSVFLSFEGVETHEVAQPLRHCGTGSKRKFWRIFQRNRLWRQRRRHVLHFRRADLF